MTEDKIEKTIKNIDLSMSMEGMPITDEDKQVMRKNYMQTPKKLYNIRRI